MTKFLFSKVNATVEFINGRSYFNDRNWEREHHRGDEQSGKTSCYKFGCYLENRTRTLHSLLALYGDSRAATTIKLAEATFIVGGNKQLSTNRVRDGWMDGDMGGVFQGQSVLPSPTEDSSGAHCRYKRNIAPTKGGSSETKIVDSNGSIQ